MNTWICAIVCVSSKSLQNAINSYSNSDSNSQKHQHMGGRQCESIHRQQQCRKIFVAEISPISDRLYVNMFVLVSRHHCRRCRCHRSRRRRSGRCCYSAWAFAFARICLKRIHIFRPSILCAAECASVCVCISA